MTRELADHPGWKGTEATRVPRHIRVYIRRGKASEYPCEHCSELGVGRQAREWAQVHDTDGNDPWNHFIPLCRRCHFKYDNLKLGGKTIKSGSPENAAYLPHHAGEQHPLSRLTEDDVRDIRRRLACGETQRSIADTYEVTPAAIGAIKSGRTWGWLVD